MLNTSNLPTPEEARALFWLIFDTLDDDVRQTLKRWWATIGPNAPQVVTDPDAFVSDVTYVTSMGSMIQMRLDRLADRKHSLLRAFYHELAHTYIAAVGGHSPDAYEKRRELHESGATKLTKVFSDNLKRTPAKRKALRAHPLIEKFSRVYDFSPLYIGDRDFATRLAAEWVSRTE